MKRDMDLIREVLLNIEGSESRFVDVDLPDYPAEVVNYHIDLLTSAGIVNGEMHWTFGGGHPVVRGLTMAGYDFLDAIRNESIWAKTKDFVKERELQSVPIDVLVAVATDFVKQQVGLNG